VDISQFIEDLIVTNAIWGALSLKMGGIHDQNNLVVDPNLTISNVSKTITLTSAVPSFLIAGKLFRIKNGGGTNQDQLFKVSSILGNKITCDPIAPYFDPQNYSGSATVDGRIWVCINNETIAKESIDGGTVFNIENVVSTGLPDGSGIALNSIGHYHGDGTSEDLDDLKLIYQHMGA